MTDQLTPPSPHQERTPMPAPTAYRPPSATAWKIAAGVLAAISLVSITMLIMRNAEPRTVTLTLETPSTDAPSNVPDSDLVQSCHADMRTLQTALEAYSANVGEYTTSQDDLVAAGLLRTTTDDFQLLPGANVVATAGGICDGIVSP